jgi:hypothetical protein
VIAGQEADDRGVGVVSDRRPTIAACVSSPIAGQGGTISTCAVRGEMGFFKASPHRVT